MDRVTVYGMSGSGNCHKLRLLLDHLRRPYDWVEVNILEGETRDEAFLARNPAGQVPVLEAADGDSLAESGAILTWLADGTPLLPADPWERAQVLRWLFFEQNGHEPYIAVSRFILRYLPPDHERRSELPRLRARGEAALRTMEGRLTGSPYIAGGELSVADFALYGYTHCADEGGYDLAAFPAVRAWVDRLEREWRFRPMTA